MPLKTRGKDEICSCDILFFVSEIEAVKFSRV
jgi:hypothetical protein